MEIFEPQDVKEHLPFENHIRENLVKIEKGNVQTIYQTDAGVLHIIPEGEDLSQEQQLICERWVHTNKATSILNSHKVATETKRDNILIPQIHFLGDFLSENQRYQYWHEDFIGGCSIKEATFNIPLIKHYDSLIKWLSQFHQNTQSDIPLREYYKLRLESIIISLSRSKLSSDENSYRISRIQQKGESLIKNLELMVDEDERLSIIHGDLRDGNILISNNKIGIIDFEQGSFGGDWFVDIEKLLKVFDNRQPNISKPYLYRPPLTQKEKTSLIEQYIKNRVSRGWCIPSVLQKQESIQKRQELVKYDTLVSMLIFRDLMGWNFKIEKNKRGTDFILDALERQNW